MENMIQNMILISLPKMCQPSLSMEQDWFLHICRPFWWNHLSTATSSLGISLFVLHLIFAWSECLKRFDGINVQNKKEKNDSGGNLPFLYYM